MLLNTVLPTQFCSQSTSKGTFINMDCHVMRKCGMCGCSARDVVPTGASRPIQPITRLQPLTARRQKRSRCVNITSQAGRPAIIVQAVSVGNRYTYASLHLGCCCALGGLLLSTLSFARRKVFDSTEAQADMRFAELLDGKNKILVISAVAPGSTGEKVCNQARLS